MDMLTQILRFIDPVLIFPYRFFDNPMIGWWIGTFCLSLWAVFVGELTMGVVSRINRKAVSESFDETLYYHEQSMKAKAAGDETAYEGINKLANEAYGKSFFLMMAMGMAALWPAFFAAAWLQMRFSEFRFPLPSWALGLEFNFIAPFILFYLFQRMSWGHFKRTRRSRPIKSCEPAPQCTESS